MEKLVECATMQGIKQVAAVVPVERKAALRLYRDLDFTERRGDDHSVVNFIRFLAEG